MAAANRRSTGGDAKKASVTPAVSDEVHTAIVHLYSNALAQVEASRSLKASIAHEEDEHCRLEASIGGLRSELSRYQACLRDSLERAGCALVSALARSEPGSCRIALRA